MKVAVTPSRRRGSNCSLPSRCSCRSSRRTASWRPARVSALVAPESKGAAHSGAVDARRGRAHGPGPLFLTASEKADPFEDGRDGHLCGASRRIVHHRSQSAAQPENLQPAEAVATRDTAVPPSNWLEQLAPQSMPAGLDTTRPDPCNMTLSRCVPGGGGVALRERRGHGTSLLTVRGAGKGRSAACPRPAG